MKNLICFSIAMLFLSGCSSTFEDEPLNDPEAIFENFWTVFNENYSGFEVRNVDWDEAYFSFRPQVTSSTGDEELFNILCEMVTPLDDGHVYITTPNNRIFQSNKIRREKIDDELFNAEIIKDNYLEDKNEGDGYFHGKIGNTAYIYFEYVGSNWFVFNDFLDKYEHADNLIIDLRHNGGGDHTYCFSEIGRLTEEDVYVFRSKTKEGPGQDDYSDWYRWYLNPEGKFFNKKIAVLIDRYTISAGERASMAFKALPNATLIGDTTNGAHSTLVGRELANGWYYTVVTQKVEMFDGISYEGLGIQPDISLQNTIEDILAGKDKVLEGALDFLKQ